jgi:bifunctional DNA-binding transcriptional regulator/antitoxin component of YhaV-PrlF toxin-antitoxin module
VTLPRAIADKFGIRPGDDIDWVAAGEVIRVIPPGKQAPSDDRDSRLRLFDQATDRIGRRRSSRGKRSINRGWRREDLYSRGRSH